MCVRVCGVCVHVSIRVCVMCVCVRVCVCVSRLDSNFLRFLACANLLLQMHFLFAQLVHFFLLKTFWTAAQRVPIVGQSLLCCVAGCG